MKQIKAIDTKYDGRYFRSRLEARWAIYLNGLDVKWRYEEEGYELPSGEWYLPDFYLYELGWYAEVKPYEQHDPRWDELVIATQKPLLLLIGEPSVSQVLLRPYEGATGEFMGTLTNRYDRFYPFFHGSFPIPVDDVYRKSIEAALSERF